MKMKAQQSPQDILKAVLWGKFIALCAYVKKSGGSPIHDLMRKLKTLEKQEQAKPKSTWEQ